MALSSDQVKRFKALAQQLKPVVLIGQHGLSSKVLSEIDVALNFHELLKIKIASDDRVERKAMALRICEHLTAELIQSIGRTATIYRHNPEKSPKASNN